MNREEYFRADWAKLSYARTRFRMPFNHTTAFNTGDIIPLEVEQIYPGDSIQSNFSYLLRLFTPLAPVMSNIYLDVYSFFVPMRLVWEHWENFYGQNDVTAWTQTYNYSIPQCYAPDGDDSGDAYHMIGEYLGLVDDLDSTYSVSDLWRRAYLKIYNDWFRDENVIAPILFSVGDSQELNPVYTYADAPLKAAKFHDYFTSLLPEPTKGDAPTLGGDMPVYTKELEHDLKFSPKWLNADGTAALPYVMVNGTAYKQGLAPGFNYDPVSGEYSDYGTYAQSMTQGSSNLKGQLHSSNVWASVGITIEDIRNAAVVTHVLEKLASSGSRYVEALAGLWGVLSADGRLQIPEYLGGKRFSINVNDVVSTADTVNSAGTEGQPIGHVGAVVKQGNGGHLFNKAFTEHGMLFTVGVVRIEQSYFQGVSRKFTDKSFFDFYLPACANIGNQPVYMEELNMQYLNEHRPSGASAGSDMTDSFRKVVLGYTEAWSHLRYTPYRLSSIMRPNALHALSQYTACDVLPTTMPDLDEDNVEDSVFGFNQAFLEQGPTGLDRAIAVPSATRGAMQWFGDFHFENIWTRILPAHSRPGLERI